MMNLHDKPTDDTFKFDSKLVQKSKSTLQMHQNVVLKRANLESSGWVIRLVNNTRNVSPLTNCAIQNLTQMKGINKTVGHIPKKIRVYRTDQKAGMIMLYR